MSIAAVNIEPPAEFFCPSITGLNTPDLSAVLQRCFEWFFARGAWVGPKLLEPQGATQVQRQRFRDYSSSGARYFIHIVLALTATLLIPFAPQLAIGISLATLLSLVLEQS